MYWDLDEVTNYVKKMLKRTPPLDIVATVAANIDTSDMEAVELTSSTFLGEHVVGQTILIAGDTVEDNYIALCLIGGNPGVWIFDDDDGTTYPSTAYGGWINVAWKHGIKHNAPKGLGADELGMPYFATDEGSNGTLLIWNGTNWVDITTGDIVDVTA